MTTHSILGRDIAMPVEIRRARAFVATYLVPAQHAQRIVAYSGLTILRLPANRAVCSLVFVDYIDGDLGPYNEFGVSFMVRHHEGKGAGVFVHELPVDGEFTLAAGRGIWGFPKQLAEFSADHDSTTRHAGLRIDGSSVAELNVRAGWPIPGSMGGSSFDAYSHIDGVTRCTRWQMSPQSARTRIGGARLRLGDHPIAQELSSLGLPKRALMTSVIPQLAMTFGDAAPV